MRKALEDGRVLKNCKIYGMLEGQSSAHISFHTPGHKTQGWDITELSYSDNLSCPHGCIAEAQRDIAEILGAEKSFILTDGSTSGVLSMLHVAKSFGVKTIAVCANAHKSVWNGCKLLGITPLVYPQKYRGKIPYTPTMSALKTEFSEILRTADALFFTSPDYYGNITDLKAVRAYCDETGKLLLIDGAHGGHLHFHKEVYAGTYADLWVDGVHKSLPAFTQGAVVSARNKRLADALSEAVDIFRTTSPSYPIMASVEYAVKYPQNKVLEENAAAFEKSCARIANSDDWTKLCAVFGDQAFDVEKDFEKLGIFPEFCDGNVLTFYLSPATKAEDFETLKTHLKQAFEKYPLSKDENVENDVQRIPAPLVFEETEVEWVKISAAEGRVCALNCGLFPPCTSLIFSGERITAEKLALLEKADNLFGVQEQKILVLKKSKE